MTSKRFAAFCVLALCLAVGSSQGAAVLSIDLNGATGAIEDELNVVVGDTVNAQVRMSVTDPDDVALYQFTVEYDAAVLRLDGFVATPPAPLNVFTGAVTTVPGEITQIDAFNLTMGAADFDQNVFGMTFTVIGPTVAMPTPNVRVGALRPSDGFFNSANAPVDFVFNNGTVVTAVPEPSSFALLGLGLGFLGFRHRRRRSKENAPSDC